MVGLLTFYNEDLIGSHFQYNYER